MSFKDYKCMIFEVKEYLQRITRIKDKIPYPDKKFFKQEKHILFRKTDDEYLLND